MFKYKGCVVLINYNSLGDTIECIKSIKQCEDELPFIVVVDNASSNTQDVISALLIFSDIKVILNSTNVGFGKANNIALDWIFENIKCEYIYILNNDTVIERNSLSLLRNCLIAENDGVGMIAPKILVYSNHEEVWYEGADIDFKKITPTIKSPVSANYTSFASGCAMFFRYDSLKMIKGFDPFFFMYDEDLELCLRMNKAGLKIYYLPSSIVYHKCQGSQTKEKDIPSNQLHPNHPSLLFYLKNTIVNRKYIIKLHLNGSKKAKAYFFHTSYWLMKSVQFFLYGKRKAGLTVLKYLFLKTSNT